MFAQVLNTAAFGDHRIVVVRYREEIGAFVGLKDLDFLRRYQPVEGSAPSEQALHEDECDLRGREQLLSGQEEIARRCGTPERRAELAAERELLVTERRWIEMLLALRKRSSAAPKN